LTRRTQESGSKLPLWVFAEQIGVPITGCTNPAGGGRHSKHG
jgi:hypothetical protein